MEARAERLRNSDLPARQHLLQLEAEKRLLGTRIRGYDELLQAATGMLAAAAQVLRRADLAAESRRPHKRALARSQADADELEVRNAFVTLTDRAARVEKVARAVGIGGWSEAFVPPNPRGMTVAEIGDWAADLRQELRDRIDQLGVERSELRERRRAISATRARLVNANDLR
ncbi:MAG: hypothetical protein R3F59_31935 [Myxococcota bacterium]